MSEVKELVDRFIEGQLGCFDENGNKNGNSISTRRDLLAGEVSREYALQSLPKEVSEAHRVGDIHIHDLDYTVEGYYNCMLLDLAEIFNNGLNLGDARIESPKSLTVATTLIPQMVTHVASNTYGGTSIHEIDKVLEPYVRKSFKKHFTSHLRHSTSIRTFTEWENFISTHTDSEIEEEKTKDLVLRLSLEDLEQECKQAFQGLEYSMNALFSSGGQTPFSTFTFGLGDSFYSRMIQRHILQSRIDGLGEKSATAVFPKLVYTLKKGLNMKEGEPNYEIKKLALKCASERIYPDILSYDKLIENYGFYVGPMGCRSFLSAYKNEEGEFVTQGRRNVGVCTLNLPRIAMETKTTQEFFDLLEKRLQLVRKALQWRVDKLKKVKAKNAPILYQYGATGHRLSPDEDVFKIFTGGEATASIGYIGLHEVATKFYGDQWRKNAEAKKFTLDILKKLNEVKDLWNKEGNSSDGFSGFSVYGTPSESLTDRFCKLDREKFGEIRGITDKGFYVNSFHVLPESEISVFEKIDFESDYPILSQGGNICYVETPILKNNLKALEQIWDYFYDKVPYAGVNQPISKCFTCGNTSEFDADAKGYYCDSCGERKNVQVVKRLCGYLSELSSRSVKEGRELEIKSRIKHKF